MLGGERSILLFVREFLVTGVGGGCAGGGGALGVVKFGVVSTTRTTDCVGRNCGVKLDNFAPTKAPGTMAPRITGVTRRRRTGNGPFRVDVFANTSAKSTASNVLSEIGTVHCHTPCAAGPSFQGTMGGNRVTCGSVRLSRVTRRMHCKFVNGMSITVLRTYRVAPSNGICLATTNKVTPAVTHLTSGIVVRLGTTRDGGNVNLRSICRPLSPPCHHRVPVCGPDSHVNLPCMRMSPGGVVNMIRMGAPSRTHSFATPSPVASRVKRGITSFLTTSVGQNVVPTDFLPLRDKMNGVTGTMLNTLKQSGAVPTFRVCARMLRSTIISLVHRKHMGFKDAYSLAIAGRYLRNVCSSVSFFHSGLIVHPSRVSGGPRVVHHLNIVSVGATVRTSVCNGMGSARVDNAGVVGNVNNSNSFAHGTCVSVFAYPSITGRKGVDTVIPVISRRSRDRRSIGVLVARRNITSLHNGDPMRHTGTVVRGYTRPSCGGVL